MQNSSVEVFRRSLDLLVAKDMAGYVQLFAEDTVVEYGFPPPGWPKRMSGRAEVDGRLSNFPDFLRIEEVRDLKVHKTTDPEVVVAELVLAGIVTATGKPYESRYIQVVTVRGGQIVHFRDYWNPLLALELMPNDHGSRVTPA